MKTCSKCRVEKPLSEFGKDRGKKDGLGSYCKACARAANRAHMAAYRAKNEALTLEERRAAKPFKRCPACGETKSSAEFPGNTATADGLSSRCAACGAARTSAWHADNGERVAKYRRENADRISEYMAAYRARRWAEDESYRLADADHKANRRALKAAQPGTVGEYSLRQHIYERDAGECWSCAAEVDFEEGHVDHLIPLRGNVVDVLVEVGYYPGTVPANLSWACGPCNLGRNNRVTPEAVSEYQVNQLLYVGDDSWTIKQPTFEQRVAGYEALMASSGLEARGPGSLIYSAIVERFNDEVVD